MRRRRFTEDDMFEVIEERDEARRALWLHHIEYTHGPGAHCPICGYPLTVPLPVQQEAPSA